MSEVLLDTPQGRLLGKTVGPDDEVNVFKGIPYAVPPVGIRRWRPAEPAPGWTDIRRADQFGPECVQPSTLEATEDPKIAFYRRLPALNSEDCLYLNVWTPAVRDRVKPYPVMVWIHGGGLVMGSGSWPLYDGTELAKKGVVLVTINYRLGIFGYFAHPELTTESPRRVSGNYATTDQIQALKWVRDNISAFGGDPENVTLFGVSGGSISISTLMVSPLATGLFHRAAGESGVAFYRVFPRLASAESAGLNFASATGGKSLQALREIPAVDLLKASRERNFLDHCSTGPVVDGHVFPDQPYKMFQGGQQRNVPVIVGSNADESYYGETNATPVDRELYVESVKATYGDAADSYLSLYPLDSPRMPPPKEFGGHVDGWSWEMEAWARMMSNVSASAYLYQFAHVPPGVEAAFHSAEVSYIFNNVRHLPVGYSIVPVLPPRESDLRMAEIMSDYWVSFAKTGTPAVDGLPKWQPYTSEAMHYMKFEAGDAVPSKDSVPGAWEMKERIYHAWNRMMS
jgi:para-nitrobenzyl esterase